MKAVCIDKSAGERLRLVQRIDQAFEACKKNSGVIDLLEAEPASREEFLLQPEPHAVILGPAFSIEDSLDLASEIRSRYPDIPLFIFVHPERMSFGILRRFEKIASEVLSFDEQDARMIYTILSRTTTVQKKSSGKIISVLGAKGGVGASTIAASLAHAGHTLSKKSLVLDLSDTHFLATVLHTERRFSPEFFALLQEKRSPDRVFLERCIESAPNGIDLLLSPRGSTNESRVARDLWLTSKETFELTLRAIEILREMYDFIIIDHARTEGLLPYALLASSDIRLVVTSPDPASIHLTAKVLQELRSANPNTRNTLCVNRLVDFGLSTRDIQNYLANQGLLNEIQTVEVPLDTRGRHWVGSGNTFYTESRRPTQMQIETILLSLLRTTSQEQILETIEPPEKKLFANLFGKKLLPQPALSQQPKRIEHQQTYVQALQKKSPQLAAFENRMPSEIPLSVPNGISARKYLTEVPKESEYEARVDQHPVKRVVSGRTS